MNKSRRIQLSAIQERLMDLTQQLTEIRDAEQEAFDNMPESLKAGEKGEKMQTAINEIDELISDLAHGVSHIDTAME